MTAVCAALAIASSGPSPHRSVSVNRASALTVTARSRLSWARSVPSPNGASAWSISPNRIPGRTGVSPGLVIVPEIIARTAPW